MKRLERVTAGSRISASHINAIVDAINELARLSVGPGLTMRQSTGGRTISLQFPRGLGGPGAGDYEPPTCTGGELAELDAEQGEADTDDWSRVDDACPVAVKIVTDVEYDTLTYKLSYRTRSLTFDRCGQLLEISAESALTEITEAEGC